MPSISQRIASAFAVLLGRYGDVTQMARDRERSRQSLYREAQRVIDAVDGTAARDRVAELEQQVARLQSQVDDLRGRLGRAVEMTPEKQAELAAKHEDLTKEAADLGVKGACGVPVLADGGVTAVLEFFTSELLQPDEPLMQALFQLGHHLGHVFDRSRAVAES